MLQRETSTYTLPGLIDYQYKRTSNHGIAVYLGNISRIQIRTDVVTSIDNLLSRVRKKKKTPTLLSDRRQQLFQTMSTSDLGVSNHAIYLAV